MGFHSFQLRDNVIEIEVQSIPEWTKWGLFLVL